MSIGPSIILAIEAAANADTDNMALHSHLASVLLEAGRCPEALEACRVVLSRRPDDFQTLDIAARAAEMVGDGRRLAGAGAARLPHLRVDSRPIDMSDFRAAMKEIMPSVNTWFDTARNYAQFANEGGAYDELAAYLRSRKMM